MSMITIFANELYKFMGLKYNIICPDFPREDVPIESYDWSASDQFTIEIGHAVLMLSYSYRTEFRKYFNMLKPVLTSCKVKAMNYALIFAKVTYTAHSPLKILVLCAFISEMYLFLLFNSKSRLVIQNYVKPSTECFNFIYKAVLSGVDDPILKWKDLKRVAALLASGYHLLQPIMETEHPSESRAFFDSVKLLIAPEDAAESQTELQTVQKADEACDKAANKKQRRSRRKTQKVNEKLYNTLKTQSQRLFPKVMETVKLRQREKSPNKNSTLTESCSGTALNSNSEIEEECLKTETHGNVKEECLKAETHGNVKEECLKAETHGNVKEECLKAETHGNVKEECLKTETHGNVEETASNVPVSEGNVETSRKYKSKRQSRSKAKLDAMKAIKNGEVNQPKPANPNAEELKVRLSGGLGCEILESSTAKDFTTDNEEDEPEGKESFV